MNLPSTDSEKYKVFLLLAHFKAFSTIVSAQNECCSFHPEGQLKFTLHSLLFIKYLHLYL